MPQQLIRQARYLRAPEMQNCRGALGRLASSCLLTLSIGACIPVPRGENPLNVRFMSTEELREYSEEVFRHHNQVMTRLMMAPIDSISPGARKKIERAESRMSETCASINKVASMRARGQDPDFELENRVRRTIRECAEQTRQVEQLLNRHGSSSGDRQIPLESA